MVGAMARRLATPRPSHREVVAAQPETECHRAPEVMDPLGTLSYRHPVAGLAQPPEVAKCPERRVGRADHRVDERAVAGEQLSLEVLGPHRLRLAGADGVGRQAL